VEVSTSTTAALSKQFSCQLSILRAPDIAGRGADWRIGHIVKPDGFRGKTIRYRVTIKTNGEMWLDTGTVYVYDGFKVYGVASQQFTSRWKTFEVTAPVDPKATTVEIWFRLLLGQGTVQPSSGVIYFIPEIELLAGTSIGKTRP
jgi:hypothetical protein